MQETDYQGWYDGRYRDDDYYERRGIIIKAQDSI